MPLVRGKRRGRCLICRFGRNARLPDRRKAPDLWTRQPLLRGCPASLRQTRTAIAGASDIMAIFGGGYSDGTNRAEVHP